MLRRCLVAVSRRRAEILPRVAGTDTAPTAVNAGSLALGSSAALSSLSTACLLAAPATARLVVGAIPPSTSLSRSLSAPTVRAPAISAGRYQEESSAVINSVADRLEEDDIDMKHPIEIHNAGDVLTVKTKRGTWVLNKHNVTRQLWLSSPTSGPSKYSYVAPGTVAGAPLAPGQDGSKPGGVWLNERDNKSKLSDLLSSEFGSIFGFTVVFRRDF